MPGSNPHVTIMIGLQKKLSKMNEILDLTKQMDDALQRNDPVSLQMVLEMRQGVMMEVDEIDYEAHSLLERMAEEERNKILDILAMKQEAIEIFELKKIDELNRKIKAVLKQTITIDKHLNMKIGENNSFYANNK